jgi:hypothetical protein
MMFFEPNTPRGRHPDAAKPVLRGWRTCCATRMPLREHLPNCAALLHANAR